MGKRLPNTPRSRIRAALRNLWLRSRERHAALKAANYTCRRCGRKGSKAVGSEVLLNVHHVGGIAVWDEIIDLIAQRILACEYIVLCKECHDKEHHNG